MKIVRFAKLTIPFDAALTRQELLATGAAWKPHMNTFHYSGAWDVLPLRSPGGSHTNPVPELMGESGFADTLYMDRFPSVKALLSSLSCPVKSARFLNLRAGAIIKQHRDLQLELEQGEARLHFPVITSPQVEFYCEDERIILNEGECWYLNANLPHRVSNNGPHDRIHLVVDCEVNDWLMNAIRSAGIIATKRKPVDENLFKVVAHYRQQNTEEANRLADELEARIQQMMADES